MNSTHQRKAKQCLRKINVSGDDWLNVFPCLAPAILGLKLALLSHQFDALVDTHFKGRKWTLGNLSIHCHGHLSFAQFSGQNRPEIVKWYNGTPETTLPVPQEPLPDNVIGFHRINICYFDRQVLAFLHRIWRLFESELALDLAIPFGENESWGIMYREIAAELTTGGISKMRFSSMNSLANWRTRIAPSILRELPNLRSVQARAIHLPFIFPEGTGDDSHGTSEGEALAKWLHTPRGDGRPNLFEWEEDGTMLERLKTTFLNATTSVSFIIVFGTNAGTAVMPFEVENWQTREQLAFRRVNARKWLILRGPIVRNGKQWAEWEREALDENWRNLLRISLHDDNIW